MARFKQYVLFNGSVEQLNAVLELMELDDGFNVLNVDYINDTKFGITYQSIIEE
jgi:hypothetical protein